MMTIYFYGSNREIVAENVKKCYSMIEKYGFNAAMGKIKLVGSEDLTGEKLLKVSIVPKSNAKPLSIDNWMLNTEEVTDATERAAAKAPVDGQHRMIYNPQNEMFRLLGTKRSFSQNETFFFSHPYPPTLPFSA